MSSAQVTVVGPPRPVVGCSSSVHAQRDNRPHRLLRPATSASLSGAPRNLARSDQLARRPRHFRRARQEASAASRTFRGDRTRKEPSRRRATVRIEVPNDARMSSREQSHDQDAADLSSGSARRETRSKHADLAPQHDEAISDPVLARLCTPPTRFDELAARALVGSGRLLRRC